MQEKIRQQNDLIAKTKNDEAEYTKYASERSSQKAELQKQQQDMIQAQILRAARAAGGGAIPQAIAGTSSYPWNDANCYVDGNAVSHGGADGNGGDGYGYGCRQCVSYAAWKCAQQKVLAPHIGEMLRMSQLAHVMLDSEQEARQRQVRSVL